jgi:hypothetical protein
MEDEVSVDVDHANRDRDLDARRLGLDAVRDSLAKASKSMIGVLGGQAEETARPEGVQRWMRPT